MIDKEYGEIAKDTWNSESRWKKPQTDDKKQNGSLGINTLKNGEWDTVKEEFKEVAIDKVTEYAPNFRKSIID